MGNFGMGHKPKRGHSGGSGGSGGFGSMGGNKPDSSGGFDMSSIMTWMTCNSCFDFKASDQLIGLMDRCEEGGYKNMAQEIMQCFKGSDNEMIDDVVDKMSNLWLYLVI